MDQHVDAIEQLVDDRGIAQVAVHDVFAGDERLERFRTGGRAQIDAALEQCLAQDAAQLAGGATQCNFLHVVCPCREERERGWVLEAELEQELESGYAARGGGTACTEGSWCVP